ncbi:hypothetical protein ACFO25_10010 [Paenactinomyces guangxiensis]|uniref:Uncharacterized protein n=1 Tax=Paenactinomyces guangxiensis TaxID=1490290 RepID=A0A7W1WSF6_9BACL|nr:hypothetical protein [Paenactinomyces guangxiensis]MBA4495119.1 hypothetical protein [Paenactinomyces guangxiensis]MBH8592197.1 hypothetical protein [Paenactinomyces guangxiensis]
MEKRYIVVHGTENTYIYDTVNKENVKEVKGRGLTSRETARQIAEEFNQQEERPGRYETLGQRIGQLVDRKQKEYGDSWGKAAGILEKLYPDGVKPEHYHNMLGIVRVIDKLSRIANGNQGEENAWADLAGYGLLGYFDKYK